MAREAQRETRGKEAEERGASQTGRWTTGDTEREL